jgi:hypothetical protein
MLQENHPHGIDWETLGISVGAISQDGSENLSTSQACQAIEMILGRDACRNAVDHYVSRKPGAELVRGVLWHIHSWAAMERCYEIYTRGNNIDERRAAVELLRVVADARVLPWIPGLLSDADDAIQTWSAGIVDQLLWSHLLDGDDCRDILKSMAGHSNERVREQYEFIRKFLVSRGEVL